jgi:SAM-dependent methyltransferase
MSNSEKIDSKEVGLEIGLILGKQFLNTEHLHYGYWTDDLDLKLTNLPQAQENYSRFIITQFPDGIENVLEIGPGTGKFVARLMEMGYRVDCVSPSSVLTEYIRDLLGDKSHIFECRFEDLQTENRYDLIVFSESFQYVNLEKALENSSKFLKDGGYLLICDFFKTDTLGKSALSGGHELACFYDLIANYPLEPLKDIDITEQTAPNLDIVNHLLMNAGFPIWNLVIRFLDANHRFVSKLLQWKFRRKIDKIHRKYFSNSRNAENFKKYKSYRLLLYRKGGE